MAEKLIQSSGKLTFLRAHDLGSGFGPQSDFIDVEVVAKLDSEPVRAMGFQLRDDKELSARQGMLDLCVRRSAGTSRSSSTTASTSTPERRTA